jgi:hypothetical protein
VSPQLALRKSAGAGLIILFHDFDDHDVHRRQWVFIALPSSFVIKLLCCLKDLRCADEFSFSERIISNDLISKGLMKKMVCAGKVYYYGLNKNAAARLLIQLLEIRKNE